VRAGGRARGPRREGGRGARAPSAAPPPTAPGAAPLEPSQPYIPLPVRFTGRFNGDSKNRLAFKDGKTIIASKGTSWAEQFEARMPDADHALIAIERMDLVDIDFDWPTKAIVAKAGFRRPAIEIERSEDGTLD